MNDRYIDRAYYLLRLLFFVGPFVAGADKFLHLLTDWTKYLSPTFASMIPISPELFMRFVGVIEMAVGVASLLGFVRFAGYAAGVWLLGITLNLAITPQYRDIALRDLGLVLAAFSLAQLGEARARKFLTVHDTLPAERRTAA